MAWDDEDKDSGDNSVDINEGRLCRQLIGYFDERKGALTALDRTIRPGILIARPDDPTLLRLRNEWAYSGFQAYAPVGLGSMFVMINRGVYQAGGNPIRNTVAKISDLIVTSANAQEITIGRSKTGAAPTPSAPSAKLGVANDCRSPIVSQGKTSPAQFQLEQSNGPGGYTATEEMLKVLIPANTPYRIPLDNFVLTDEFYLFITFSVAGQWYVAVNWIERNGITVSECQD